MTGRKAPRTIGECGPELLLGPLRSEKCKDCMKCMHG